MHFFTLFGSVTNLTFTLFRNCRFCHFYTPFNRSIIIPPFLHTMSVPFNRSIIGSAVFYTCQRPIQHVCRCCIDIVSGMTLHEHLDRFRHFYTPFNRSVIGSTIFAHHSMGLYRMSVVSVSILCLGCRHTRISIDSVIFTHHSIGLSSIPPFLHMSAAYTACGCVPWSQIPSRYMSRTMDSHHLKYHHVTRPEP